MSRLIALVIVLFFQTSSAIAGWSDWWKTPEQQALELYETGDAEALLELAPSEQWQGIGQFETGDFNAASQTFDTQRQTLLENGESAKANTSLYNQALSDIMSGQYQKAIEDLDQLLLDAPDYADAQHNRDIAQQLLELEQQQQNSEQNGEGEPNDSESQQSDSSGEGEQSDDSSDPSDSQEEQNSDQSEGSSGDDSDASESKTDEQQAEEAQQASDALEAEAKQEETDESGESDAIQAVENDQPLSESEQATEQLLRRIPDDPRGLLRRKLEQSHRSEYPEVRDAQRPW